jgi:hypothetical protein
LSADGAELTLPGALPDHHAMVQEPMPDDVTDFIGKHVDSVPHLEALLLIWQSRSHPWSVAEIAGRIYLHPDRAERVLQDLVEKQWVVQHPNGFVFNGDHRDAPVIAHLAEHYRSNLIRIAELVHRKASPAVRDFARAFELRKDP